MNPDNSCVLRALFDIFREIEVAPPRLSPTGRSEALAPGKPLTLYRNPS
jgi:hypothetical protein